MKHPLESEASKLDILADSGMSKASLKIYYNELKVEREQLECLCSAYDYPAIENYIQDARVLNGYRERLAVVKYLMHCLDKCLQVF